MHRSAKLTLTCLGALAAGLLAHAQYVWTGQGNSNSATDDFNWQGQLAPSLSNGTENLVFGDIFTTRNVVQIPNFWLNNITFNGTNRPEYSFTGSTTSLTLGGNLTASAGSPNSSPIDFSNTLGIVLTAGNHTVDVTQTVVHVNSTISETGGAASFTKTGTGIVYLNASNNTYTGGTTINQGRVVSTNSGAFGSGSITVNNGGNLEVNDALVSNTLVLNSGSILSGHNAYFNNATIGNGAILSPGSTYHNDPAGYMSFHDLTLAGGGIYEIDFQYNGEGFYHDQVNVSSVNTLTITADANNPFTLRLVSLNNSGQTGVLDGSLMGVSFEILSYSGLSGNFILGQNLLIDTSEFQTNYPEVAFSITNDGASFYLNVTPVPEPSTYALMVLGLGVIGVTVWRRRQKAS